MLSPKTLEYTKLAANIISGMGVSKVVHDIIDTNTVSTSTLDSVKIWIGSGVIASVVVDHTSSHILAKIDKLAAWVAETKENAISE